jgi:hypothetical protein
LVRFRLSPQRSMACVHLFLFFIGDKDSITIGQVVLRLELDQSTIKEKV